MLLRTASIAQAQPLLFVLSSIARGFGAQLHPRHNFISQSMYIIWMALPMLPHCPHCTCWPAPKGPPGCQLFLKLAATTPQRAFCFRACVPQCV